MRRLRRPLVAESSWALALFLGAAAACSSTDLHPVSPPEEVGGDGGSSSGVAGSAAGDSTPSGGANPSGSGGQPPAGGVANDSGGEDAVAVGGEPGGSAGAPAEPHEPAVLELSGAYTHVHDPDIVRDGDTYYLFATGEGIEVRSSKDLLAWKKAGSVFASKPSWITTTDPGSPNTLWAPEVRFFGGKFHLYYAASKFGSKQSCIGHATRSSLASGTWQDQGQAVICSNLGPSVDYNAIDPSPFEDQQGHLWLAFGSFWSGLKLIRLNADGERDGADLYALSTRSNTAVEAPHLHYAGGFYYLFESVDACCQGAASTYKIFVGRSQSITGPYVDRDGKQLLDGGGTLVLQGDQRWRGPGHNAVLVDAGRTLNVYHSYDANSDGLPTLRISEMSFDDAGWPVSAGP